MYFCRRNMFDQNGQLLIYFSNRSIFNGKLKKKKNHEKIIVVYRLPVVYQCYICH